MDHDGVEVLEGLQLFHVLTAQAPKLPLGWQLGQDALAMGLAEMMMKGQLQIVLQLFYFPFLLESWPVGIDEDEGCVECNLVLGKAQGTQGAGEVKDGADELAAAQGSEQLHATVFAFKKDCVVVSVVGSAHPDQHHFHCSCFE